ncbi:glutathione-disulfide reductase [Pseudoxanthomonas broegbernensis]|uniref:Glutathione-disulfide reductase n=1 Tax=Pseudoxanthomonas broegbernensis TaxID=83619 RepID=A0A7V8K6Y9_9GAMM|nr:glutathione-disulfide reductase [Pseudoxanthomonas broegbernensis]KAF1686242.1 glutathione-disulfide reductase [Pseudoxanthomonas broegbernensis]
MSQRRDAAPVQAGFDLVVIGGGAGGLAAAFRAAEHGARVALLEPRELGGTCVNTGCVPKKAMWLAADLAGKIALAADLGFEAPPPALDWEVLVAHRQRYIGNIHASYRRRLDEAGIAWMPCRGRLLDAHTVDTDSGMRLRTGHVLVATGGRPLRPDMPGAELGGVSDDFFDLRQAPARVAIVGGGYVAVELAGVLQGLGSRVEVFARGPRLLSEMDAQVVAQLQEDMRAQGVRLHLEAPVHALEARDGRVRVLQKGSLEGAPPDAFDTVLFATGRRPNSDGMGLEEAGVRIGERHQVEVDDYENTSLDGVYAVGDVTGKLALTPVAIAAARRLMDRLFGGRPEARLDYDQVATVVFSHPPLGTVGLTEERARARHGDAVKVFTAGFRPMLHALADSPRRSLFKLVCVGEEERVAGIHLLGDAADEILQGFAVALKLGVTRRQLEDTVAIHPTSAEEVVLMH